jgi:hypothetical protein
LGKTQKFKKIKLNKEVIQCQIQRKDTQKQEEEKEGLITKQLRLLQ